MNKVIHKYVKLFIVLSFLSTITFGQIQSYPDSLTTSVDTVYSNTNNGITVSYRNSNLCNKFVQIHPNNTEVINQRWLYGERIIAEAIYKKSKLISISYFSSQEDSLQELYFEFDKKGLITKEVYVIRSLKEGIFEQMKTKFLVDDRGLRKEFIILNEE